LDFSDQGLLEAKNAADGFYDLFTRLKEPEDRTTADKRLMEAIERCKVVFHGAMDDDFNTSVALAELQRLKSDVNKLLSQGLSTEARKMARDEFRLLGNILGLFQLDKWQFGPFIVLVHQVEEIDQALPITVKSSMMDVEIERSLQERNEARKQKDFKKADEIRQFLASHGIVIEDKPDGTSRWKR
jgi:cysteinyl-tRNA synthetase